MEQYLNENDAELLNEYYAMTDEQWRDELFKIKQMKKRNGDI